MPYSIANLSSPSSGTTTVILIDSCGWASLTRTVTTRFSRPAAVLLPRSTDVIFTSSNPSRRHHSGVFQGCSISWAGGAQRFFGWWFTSFCAERNILSRILLRKTQKYGHSSIMSGDATVRKSDAARSKPEIARRFAEWLDPLLKSKSVNELAAALALEAHKVSKMRYGLRRPQPREVPIIEGFVGQQWPERHLVGLPSQDAHSAPQVSGQPANDDGEIKCMTGRQWNAAIAELESLHFKIASQDLPSYKRQALCRRLASIARIIAEAHDPDGGEPQ